MYCWIQFADSLLSSSWSVFTKDTGLWFSYNAFCLVWYLSGLGLNWSYFSVEGLNLELIWGNSVVRRPSFSEALSLPSFTLRTTLLTFLPTTAAQSTGIFCLPSLLHFQTNNRVHRLIETCSLYVIVTYSDTSNFRGPETSSHPSVYACQSELQGCLHTWSPGKQGMLRGACLQLVNGSAFQIITCP